MEKGGKLNMVELLFLKVYLLNFKFNVGLPKFEDGSVLYKNVGTILRFNRIMVTELKIKEVLADN